MASLHTGSGVPSSGTGSDGDVYVDTNNGDLYAKLSGTWEERFGTTNDGAVTTDKIAANNVTLDKLATDTPGEYLQYDGTGYPVSGRIFNSNNISGDTTLTGINRMLRAYELSTNATVKIPNEITGISGFLWLWNEAGSNTGSIVLKYEDPGSPETYYTVVTVAPGEFALVKEVGGGYWGVLFHAPEVIPSTIDATGLEDAIAGHIEVAANKTYVLDQSAAYAYTVNSLTIESASGTCTAKLQIDGVAVTGISAVSVGSETVATASGANAVAVGQTLELVISSNSAALDVGFTVKITRA